MKIQFTTYGIILCLLSGSILTTAGCIENNLRVDNFTSDNITNLEDTYIIVDTGQINCYDNNNEISCPTVEESFYGQDAQYFGNQPSYQKNGDGTITDLNTGLMWVQYPGDKMNYAEAIEGVDSFNLAGYNDWRVPSIKELYSLIDFRGTDPDPSASSSEQLTPFIDTEYFIFEYGDTSAGERIIDSQWVTTSIYESTVMDGQEGFFGVNFADGRIKCYPTSSMQDFFVRYVRGNTYGINNFVDNGDGTITDQSTGLIWQMDDSGQGMNWEDALSYAENLNLAGYDDWRLPNAKELQSIIDYSRCPDTTGSAAIDPIFDISSITNEAGETDYPFFWTSTTHIHYPENGEAAAYLSFGRALGYWNNHWTDVHGAGAQRSDPKKGDPGDYPFGHGPQGDAIRIYNYVRCVRGGLFDNLPPEKPSITGTVSGKSGVEYEYNIVSIDPEGDEITYSIDWGLGLLLAYGPYESGEEITLTNTWNEEGNYTILVKAKDPYGGESELASLEISMPISKSQSYNNFSIEFKGGFGLKIIITNNGDTTIPLGEIIFSIYAPWMILGGETTTTISDIPPGAEETITIGFLFGFGQFKATVNILDITETRNGFILGPFVILY